MTAVQIDCAGVDVAADNQATGNPVAQVHIRQSLRVHRGTVAVVVAADIQRALGFDIRRQVVEDDVVEVSQQISDSIFVLVSRVESDSRLISSESAAASSR